MHDARVHEAGARDGGARDAGVHDARVHDVGPVMPGPHTGDPRFFQRAGPHSLAAVADAARGEAPPRRLMFRGVAPLAVAGPEEVGFLDNRKYLAVLAGTRAGAVIVHPDLADKVPATAVAILSPEVHAAWARVAALFHPFPPAVPGAHPSAVVAADARIDPTAEIGPLAVIEAGAVIGRRTRIGPLAVIGAGVEIGADCRIGAHASLSHAQLGDRVYIHPGARIGQEGFGFAITPEGFLTVPQLGRVLIHDDVEIGANSTVDPRRPRRHRDRRGHAARQPRPHRPWRADRPELRARGAGRHRRLQRDRGFRAHGRAGRAGGPRQHRPRRQGGGAGRGDGRRGGGRATGRLARAAAARPTARDRLAAAHGAPAKTRYTARHENGLIAMPPTTPPEEKTNAATDAAPPGRTAPGEAAPGEAASGGVIDISGIMHAIPHRYPFLLVDRIVDVVLGESAVGIKNVSVNEPFFVGHFPGHPVMPGVLIIESMAQTAAVLVVETLGPDAAGKVVYFMSIENAKFRRPVVPGDQLRVQVVKQRRRGNVWKFQGTARVGDVVVAEAVYAAMIMMDNAAPG